MYPYEIAREEDMDEWGDEDASSSQTSSDSDYMEGLKQDLYNAIYEASEGVQSTDAANEALSTSPRTMQPFAAAAAMEFKCTAFGRTHEMPCTLSPGLYVPELGRLNSPLTHNDALAISRIAAEKPPSDLSDLSDASNDFTQQGLYTLDAARFSFQNPMWPAYLQQIMIPHALLKFGFSRESDIERISARPSKLTLYSSGNAPIPSSVGVNSLGYLGSLEILIPSQNSGASYHSKAKGREFKFETDTADCEWKSYWIATTGDAEGPTLNIREGFQLVMTYDLLRDYENGKAITGREAPKKEQTLNSTLERWQQTLHKAYVECPLMLAHQLGDYYDDNSLVFDNLKGRDRFVVRLLRQACLESGFQICLANIHRTVQESCYEDEDPDETFELNKVVCPCGENGQEDEIGKHVPFDPGWFLEGKDEFYENSFPYSEEGGDDWSENDEGRTMHYRDTIVLLVPNSRFGELLQSSPKFHIWKWARHLAREAVNTASLMSRQQHGAKISDLHTLCRSVISQGPAAASDIKLDIHGCSHVLKNGYVQRMTHTLSTAGTLYKLSVVLEEQQDIAADALSIIEEIVRDWASVSPVNAFLATSSLVEDIGFSSMVGPISKACASLNSLAIHWEVLQRLHQMSLGVSPEKAEGFQPWFASEVQQMLGHRKVLSKADGEAVACLIATQHEYKHGEYVNQESAPVMPTPPLGIDTPPGLHIGAFNLLHQPESRIIATITFLNKLGQTVGAWHKNDGDQESESWAANPSKADAHESPNLILLEAVLNHCLIGIQSERESGRSPMTQLEWLEAVHFTHICFRHAAPSMLRDFWMGLSSEVQTGRADHLWIPYFRCLLEDDEMSTLANRTSAEIARDGFTSIMSSFIQFAVGTVPSKPKTWARSVPKGVIECTIHGQRRWNSSSRPCADCCELRDFLEDPQTRKKTFWTPAEERKHIERSLPYGMYITSTDRSKKPFGLIVEKTLKEYEQEMHKWESRKREVKAKLVEWQHANPRRFRELLGVSYDDIMSLKPVGRNNENDSEAATTNSGPLGEADPNIVSTSVKTAKSRSRSGDIGFGFGRKRRAGEMEAENDEVQIIDLT